MNLYWMVLIAFWIGAVPTAYLVAKRIKGVDIRTIGSGNVGATNASRLLGKKVGILIFVADALKGFLPAVFLPILFQGPIESQGAVESHRLLIGSGAVLGHIFTPFLGFKGGKGVATGAGVLLAFNPFIFFVSTVVWVALFSATRIVSVSSLAAVLVTLGLCLYQRKPASLILGLLTLFLLLLWTHRSNILRLLKGEENKL